MPCFSSHPPVAVSFASDAASRTAACAQLHIAHPDRLPVMISTTCASLASSARFVHFASVLIRRNMLVGELLIAVRTCVGMKRGEQLQLLTMGHGGATDTAARLTDTFACLSALHNKDGFLDVRLISNGTGVCIT